jgi:hypothetical protein
MDDQRILGGVLGIAVFLAGHRAVRSALRRTMRSRRARVEGTWQYDVTRASLRDGPRFEANVYSLASAVVIGLCCTVAAVCSLAPVWIGALGLGIAVLGMANIESQARYGSGSLRNVGRVMRAWLHL